MYINIYIYTIYRQHLSSFVCRVFYNLIYEEELANFLLNDETPILSKAIKH